MFGSQVPVGDGVAVGRGRGPVGCGTGSDVDGGGGSSDGSTDGRGEQIGCGGHTSTAGTVAGCNAVNAPTTATATAATAASTLLSSVDTFSSSAEQQRDGCLTY